MVDDTQPEHVYAANAVEPCKAAGPSEVVVSCEAAEADETIQPAGVDEAADADEAKAPASGRIPCELRLMIWSEYFAVTTLAYHTLTAPKYSFTHLPPLLDTVFRSEALPYYLNRLLVDLGETETRYRSDLKGRPADECPESTYRAWVTLLETAEIQIRALRREIEAVRVEIYGPKVMTEKSLRELLSTLDISA